MNLIRVWGGGITERPEFYDACDRAGMLVMQEFWMTGDNNGRWAGSYEWPTDHDVYLRAVSYVALVMRSYAELRGVTRSYTELHGVTRSYSELHGVRAC